MTKTKTQSAGARTQCGCGVETNVMGRATDGSLHPGKACERTQHTPGPWSKIQMECGGEVGIRCHKGILAVTTGDTDEDNANARLIAAAPELLEMCRKAKTIIENENTSFAPSIRPAVLDVLTEINTTIDKAEGK